MDHNPECLQPQCQQPPQPPLRRLPLLGWLAASLGTTVVLLFLTGLSADSA
jgi:hypothetical protein